jgi:hypothetical protein
MKLIKAKWKKEKRWLWGIFNRYCADWNCPHCDYLMSEWELHYNFGKNQNKKYYMGFPSGKEINETINCPYCYKLYQLFIEKYVKQ